MSKTSSSGGERTKHRLVEGPFFLAETNPAALADQHEGPASVDHDEDGLPEHGDPVGSGGPVVGERQVRAGRGVRSRLVIPVARTIGHKHGEVESMATMERDLRVLHPAVAVAARALLITQLGVGGESRR